MNRNIFNYGRWLLLAILLLNSTADTAFAEDNFFDDPLATQAHLKSSPVMPCTRQVPQDKELGLADVIEFSLCNNPQTRQSWANVLDQAAKLGSSRSAYLPTISGTGDASRSFSKTKTLGNSADTELSPAVSLSYLLLDFGGRDAAVESTKAALVAADYTHDATLQSVLFSAIQAYYQLFSAQASVVAAIDNVKSTKAGFDAASLRYKVGAATIADKLQAETAYAQATLTQQQAENLALTNKGVLANVMGLAPDYDFSISKDIPKELNADFGEDVKQLLEEAKKSRPDLAASIAKVSSAKANLDLQKSNDLPSITASASKNYNYVEAGRSGNSNGSTFGATLHIPIFTGFNNSYQITSAREELEAQMATQAETENNILLDVWKTYSNFLTAQKTMSTTDILLASAKKSEEVVLGRYKAGAGNITDVLSAQAQLANARQQRVQAQYDWLIAKADLLRAMGKLNKETIKEKP